MVCGVDRGSVVSAWGLWVSLRVCGLHGLYAVSTEGIWFPQGSVVFTEVCGVHRGSVGFTEGPWVSRRDCGVHRVSGVHGEFVVFTEGM